MALFAPRKFPLLGVDISSTAIKLLQLGGTTGHYRVEHYAIESLPPNAVTQKSLIEVEVVGEAIARALKRSGSKLKHAAAAMAGSAVMTRVLQLPSGLSEEELESQIHVEAAHDIPYPIDEVSLDYEVLGPDHDNPELNQVLVAASHTENVDMRVAALELGGLSAQVIDVEAFAMENAFSLIADQFELGRDTLVAVIDIGAAVTVISVLRDRRSIYVSEQSFGGQQLIDEIMRQYGMSYEEAHQSQSQGKLPESYTHDVLAPFKESLVQQLGRLLQLFYARGEYSEVGQVILTGGCASIAGIAGMLESHLGVPCAVGNPFVGMSLSAHVSAEALKRKAPSLMVAAGLAMRSFD